MSAKESISILSVDPPSNGGTENRMTTLYIPISLVCGFSRHVAHVSLPVRGAWIVAGFLSGCFNRLRIHRFVLELYGVGRVFYIEYSCPESTHMDALKMLLFIRYSLVRSYQLDPRTIHPPIRVSPDDARAETGTDECNSRQAGCSLPLAGILFEIPLGLQESIPLSIWGCLGSRI